MNLYAIILVISLIIVLSLGAYYFISHKNENYCSFDGEWGIDGNKFLIISGGENFTAYYYENSDVIFLTGQSLSEECVSDVEFWSFSGNLQGITSNEPNGSKGTMRISNNLLIISAPGTDFKYELERM